VRELNKEQIQQIEYITATTCTTVKEQKGSATQEQLGANVNAKIGGVFGKIIPLGGGAQGSVSQQNYEGLSQDATAAALEGDRGCKERVFIRMFDKFIAEDTGTAEAARGAAAAPAIAAPSAPTTAPATTAPPGTGSTECVVNNPSGRPMNVRETPNGAKKDSISNHAHVRPVRFASAADGKPWAYVSDVTGREIGWVFFPYLTCNGPGIR
jgi:hypothetical protein